MGSFCSASKVRGTMKLFIIFQYFVAQIFGECLNGGGDFLTFGGLNVNRQTTKVVSLVNITSEQSCPRIELPVDLKEAQIFEYGNTLLLCTSFTRPIRNKLQCFTWSHASGGEWLSFDTPSGNRVLLLLEVFSKWFLKYSIFVLLF